MNTAASTEVIAMIAPVIWRMALRVASSGLRCSSRMMRSTASTTTMASSTTMPIASTIANSDSWLMEKPTTYMPRSVPSSAAGTTSVGMSVARKFCRNTSITRNTSATASMSVIATSRIATLMKVVESNGQNQLVPAGKLGSMSFIRAVTSLCTSSALASGDSWMPKAATGWLSTLVSKPYCAAPRLTVATSFSRTEAPFGSVRSRMFSNCSGVLKRPSALTVAVMAWPATAGCEPSAPEANCAFCACTAASACAAERL